MIQIIVQDQNGTVISKDIYAGNDVANRELIQSAREKNPTFSYTEVDEQTFIQASVSIVEEDSKTPSKTEYSKISDTDSKVDFIATFLGLK